MILCKNCKWWNSRAEEDMEGKCSHPKFIDDLVAPIDGLAYGSMSAFSAAVFSTGQDFGCIHGEKE